jgi:heme-degrading monooxygenase HmoA
MFRLALVITLLCTSLLSPSAIAQDSKVVLINVFEVEAEQEAKVMEVWLQSKDFLAKQPGYINTRLHKNIDATGKFRFINVAEWATARDFGAASKAMNESSVPKMPQGVRFTPGLFTVVAQ